MRMLILGSLSLGFVLGACNAYSPDLGANPFLCGAEDPKCPDGYTCTDDGNARMVCVANGGAIVDAPLSGFQCADDSTLETATKNDTIQTAYQTPVATQRLDIAFAGLAICPEGDKDNYAINTTTANQNLEITVTWDSGMPMSASILNNGGASIGNATSNGERSIKAYVANLPTGTYYAQVFAAATTKNNYKLAIKVAGP